LTNDVNLTYAGGSVVGQRSVVTGGLALAGTSAVAFSLSGPLAKGLFDAGWSTGGVLLVRTGLGAILLAPFALSTLRHRWHVVGRSLHLIGAYAVFAVGGAQFAYLSAVQHMQVGAALLIEYTAPAGVVVWMWLRHGQRPGRLTVAGAALAAVGLVLVLDVISGADLNTLGVLWALTAMIGCAVYFVINADDSTGLPPLALAWLGLLLATVLFGVLALLGLIPIATSTAAVHYAGMTAPWWLPVILLGAVTSAVAYGTGVAAARRLGPRLASFVALLEVVGGVAFAWLLLGELPRAVQVAGGLLILTGLVVVKLGETPTEAPDPETSAPHRSTGITSVDALSRSRCSTRDSSPVDNVEDPDR
jgi:drug/metabolite transporter (DMT)-like permease